MRQFATSNTIQLLVMNIQAFQKDVEEDADPTKANIINRAQDRMSGRRPIEFIQATRPVVVIDEPQNMEIATRPSRRSRGSTRSARCATRQLTSGHTTATYRLGPIEAYDLQLVKRIEVASVVADENPNAAFVRLMAVDVGQGSARRSRSTTGVEAFKTKKLWVTCRRRPAPCSPTSVRSTPTGWIVSDISFRPGAEAVEFTNGSEVTIGEAAASFDEDMRKAQIVETVRQHLDKERTLASARREGAVACLHRPGRELPGLRR